MSYFIGIDVGGTTSTVAIGNDKREIVRITDQFSTRASEGPTATIEDIATNIEAELKKMGSSPQEAASVVIATPGPATLDGVLGPSPNLRHPEWVNCGIRQRLQDRLSTPQHPTPVAYLGDGQAAALGEFMVRSKKLAWADAPPLDPDDPNPEQLDSLFFLAVGTGLGGGEVRDGKVVRGRKGRAGHAGHVFLPHDAFRYEHDRQLMVGRAYGSAESAISLTALTHQLGYRLSLPEWKDHPLNTQEGTVKDKARKLREMAADGDELALQLFDDQAAALGIALLTVNYIGDLDLLVIGGGVCDLSDDLRRRYLRIAEASYEKHALHGFENSGGFAFSQCGDQASVIGALAEAYEIAGE